MKNLKSFNEFLNESTLNEDMTVGKKIDLLVNATDDYAEIRLKTSDQFIEMMKFMYKDKYKLIKHKEKEYFKMLDIIKSISDGLKPKQR